MDFIAYFVIIASVSFLVFLFVPNKKQRDYVILTLLLVLGCLGGGVLALGQLGVA